MAALVAASTVILLISIYSHSIFHYTLFLLLSAAFLCNFEETNGYKKRIQERTKRREDKHEDWFLRVYKFTDDYSNILKEFKYASEEESEVPEPEEGFW